MSAPRALIWMGGMKDCRQPSHSPSEATSSGASHGMMGGAACSADDEDNGSLENARRWSFRECLDDSDGRTGLEAAAMTAGVIRRCRDTVKRERAVADNMIGGRRLLQADCKKDEHVRSRGVLLQER